MTDMVLMVATTSYKWTTWLRQTKSYSTQQPTCWFVVLTWWRHLRCRASDHLPPVMLLC